MVKVRITDIGIIEEAGDGVEFDTSIRSASTYSGSANFTSVVSASAGLTCVAPQTGTLGPYFSLNITSSAGSDGAFNGILMHGTGSSVGVDGGHGMALPAGAALIFFDPDFQPIGGSVTGALKIKIGSTVRVLSMSAI